MKELHIGTRCRDLYTRFWLVERRAGGTDVLQDTSEYEYASGTRIENEQAARTLITGASVTTTSDKNSQVCSIEVIGLALALTLVSRSRQAGVRLSSFGRE